MNFALGPYLYGLLLIVAFIALIRSKNVFTLSNYFIAEFFIVHGPSFFIYNYTIGYSSVYNKLSFALFFSLLFFYIGRKMVIFSKGQSPNYGDWYDSPIQSNYINNNLLIIISLCSVILMLLALFFYGGLEFILEGWSIDYRDLVTGKYLEMRKEGYLAEAGAFGYLVNYIVAGIAPFISFVLIGYSLKNRGRRSYLFYLSLIFVIIIIVSKLSTLRKAPGAYYIIQLVIFRYLLGSKKINIGKLIKTTIVALLVLIPIYLKFTIAESPTRALALIAVRVTMVPNECLTDYFEAYPESYPHTWGLNTRVLHSIFGKGEYIPAHSLINPIGGTSNALYVADAWVDYSWGGIILYSFILGVILSYLDYLIVASKNILSIAMFSALLASVHAVINTSLITCFLTFGLLTIPILKGILGWKYSSSSSALRDTTVAGDTVIKDY